jgi:hypothetical protein
MLLVAATLARLVAALGVCLVLVALGVHPRPQAKQSKGKTT